MKHKYLRIIGFVFYAYVLRYALAALLGMQAGIKGFKRDFKYEWEDFPSWKDGMSNRDAVKTAWRVLNEDKNENTY